MKKISSRTSCIATEEHEAGLSSSNETPFVLQHCDDESQSPESTSSPLNILRKISSKLSLSNNEFNDDQDNEDIKKDFKTPSSTRYYLVSIDIYIILCYITNVTLPF